MRLIISRILFTNLLRQNPNLSKPPRQNLIKLLTLRLMKPMPLLLHNHNLIKLTPFRQLIPIDVNCMLINP